MPDLSTVHIDQALTNLSVMYSNPMYQAEEIFPSLPVVKRSDKYFVYNKATALSSSGLDANGKAKSLRRPSREAPTIDYALSTDSYYCEEYALRELVTDAQRKYADNPLQPDNDATIQLTSTLMLDNELMTQQMVCNAANYPTANKATLVTTTTSWAAYSASATTSLPMKNVQDAKTQIIKQIQRSPNNIALTHGAAKVLSEHPTYRDEFKYVSKEGLTESGLLPILKGLNVIELLAQTTTGDVWVDVANSNACALIFYKNPDMGPRSVHFGRTFDAPDDTTSARGVSMRRYRWDPLKGEYIEAAMTRDYKFISVDTNGKAIGGYLYSNVIV